MSSTGNSPNHSPTSQSSSKPVSHYLHPDYLDPLRVTTDAKQSPLALLAETCNNIGKDILPLKKPLNNNSILSDRKRNQVSPSLSASPSKKASQESKQSYNSARSSPRAVCPDTSQTSPVNTSPNPSTRSRSRSPQARKAAAPATTCSQLKTPENHSNDTSNSTTSPPQKSPTSNFLMNNVLGYNPYASLGLPWSTALMAASHSPNTPCMDPYCPHCHVTHRPCACLQCLQQKLLGDPYAAYLASLHQLTSAASSNPATGLPNLSSNLPSSNVTAEYCIYCGKHCPSPDDLISHMQMHLTKKEPTSPQHVPPVSLSSLYTSGLDLAKSLMTPSRPFPPFRPPMPSRLAAHLANYPFGAGLV